MYRGEVAHFLWMASGLRNRPIRGQRDLQKRVIDFNGRLMILGEAKANSCVHPNSVSHLCSKIIQWFELCPFPLRILFFRLTEIH
jgi:hypothetical protein